MDRAKTERLITLLHAQRDEVARRSVAARDSESWSESSSRLDDLNDQIMHMGTHGSTIRQAVGDGLELDLDSRPVEDAPFRREVVDTVRHAVVVMNHVRLARQLVNRFGSGTERLRQARELVQTSQAVLRAHYPNATISPSLAATEPGTIAIRADRDGRVA